MSRAPFPPMTAGPKVFGYARVSTDDQELRVQIDALEKRGCDRIYEEKKSGSRQAQLWQLEIVRLTLRPGDTLVVYRLDRLGRNLKELVEFVEMLERREVTLECVQTPIDLKSAQGKMMFHMYCAMAQMESDIASERTKEGMKAARAAGKQIGAKSKMETMTQGAIEAVTADCRDPNMSMNAIAKKHKMTNATLKKWWSEPLIEAGKMKRK